MIAAIGAGLLSGRAAYSQATGSAGATFRAISVETEPDATVWLDGVRYGNTDKSGILGISTVSAGSHAIRVRADGFKEKTQPLTAIQKGEIKIPLVKTTDEAELAFQEAERLTIVDRDKAADAYRKAIKLRPNYPEALIGLARVLSDSGDLEEAGKAITSARKLRPGYAEASASRAASIRTAATKPKLSQLSSGRSPRERAFSLKLMRDSAFYSRRKPKVPADRAISTGENDNYNESAKDLKMAIKQLSGAPDSIVIYQLLGVIYERQKRIDEAIAIYEEFLRIFPNSVEATAVKSFIVQLKKDTPKITSSHSDRICLIGPSPN